MYKQNDLKKTLRFSSKHFAEDLYCWYNIDNIALL